MSIPLSFMGVPSVTDTDNPAILITLRYFYYFQNKSLKSLFTGMQAVYFSSRDIIDPWTVLSWTR